MLAPDRGAAPDEGEPGDAAPLVPDAAEDVAPRASTGEADGGCATPPRGSPASDTETPAPAEVQRQREQWSGLHWDRIAQRYGVRTVSEIEWHHATNTKQRLMQALHSRCHLLEADVMLGEYVSKAGYSRSCAPVMQMCIDRKTTDIICAHYPTTITSDLRLSDLLDRLVKYNRIKREKGQPTRQKGVKLDFKAIEALEKSIEYLIAKEAEGLDIWINADIVAGPGGLMVPITPARFFEEASKVPNSVLSLGWTSGVNVLGNAFTDEMVDDMIAVLDVAIHQQATEVKGRPFTFAINDQLATRSVETVCRLLDHFPGCSLTLFSSALSYGLRREELEDLQRALPADRTFFDVRTTSSGCAIA